MGVYNNFGDFMRSKCIDCPNAKHLTCEEKKSIIKRLNVIEGQVRGIKQMVETDRFCEDVLTQVSAVSRSIKSIGNELLKNHLSTCVVNDLKQGNTEVIDDVLDMFDKLNK